MGYEYNNILPLSERRYVLQDRDGGYVKSVHSGNTETLKLHFEFTYNKAEAKEFSFNDLWNPLATTAVGMEFTKGFAGGRAVRVR